MAFGVQSIILLGMACRSWLSQDAMTPERAKQLTGEWLLSSSVSASDQPLVIWTFKSDGIVRIDAADPKSREKVHEGPMVGRWQVKGEEIICIWEVWNDKHQRPGRGRETEERLHLRSVSKSELELEVVGRGGKPVVIGELLQYKRFAGWQER